mmetsp:Transcript_96839/g.257338  ORF Transcript_96839/g.257338 Transcript_96839/m.257338 type:complete len:282 (+) Transcript_96839:198-1043(+)
MQPPRLRLFHGPALPGHHLELHLPDQGLHGDAVLGLLQPALVLRVTELLVQLPEGVLHQGGADFQPRVPTVKVGVVDDDTHHRGLIARPRQADKASLRDRFVELQGRPLHLLVHVGGLGHDGALLMGKMEGPSSRDNRLPQNVSYVRILGRGHLCTVAVGVLADEDRQLNGLQVALKLVQPIQDIEVHGDGLAPRGLGHRRVGAVAVHADQLAVPSAGSTQGLAHRRAGSAAQLQAHERRGRVHAVVVAYNAVKGTKPCALCLHFLLGEAIVALPQACRRP